MKTTTAAIILWTAMVSAAGGAGRGAEVNGRVAEAEQDGLAAVVWLAGFSGQGLAVPKGNTTITHRDGQLRPFISVGFVGNDYVLRNDDSVLHNSHLYMKLSYQKERSQRPLFYGADLYNIALPRQGAEVHRQIKPYHALSEDTGFIEVICNPHPDERAFVFIFDHPYAARTDAEGRFAFADVPAGTYQLRVWQAGEIREGGQVDVREGEATSVLVAAAE